MMGKKEKNIRKIFGAHVFFFSLCVTCYYLGEQSMHVPIYITKFECARSYLGEKSRHVPFHITKYDKAHPLSIRLTRFTSLSFLTNFLCYIV